jgi:hypothetical protein
MSDERKEALMCAQAALQDIISKGQAISASAVRAGGEKAHETIRSDAHAILDAYLDHMAEAGARTRALLD